MKTPKDILATASSIIDERGQSYGQIENNFELIADIASLRIGRDIHPYEVAVIMACVKHARLFANPTHADSRIDAINYEAFAAIFADDYAGNIPQAEISYRRRKAKRQPEPTLADVLEAAE